MHCIIPCAVGEPSAARAHACDGQPSRVPFMCFGTGLLTFGADHDECFVQLYGLKYACPSRQTPQCFGLSRHSPADHDEYLLSPQGLLWPDVAEACFPGTGDDTGTFTVRRYTVQVSAEGVSRNAVAHAANVS